MEFTRAELKAQAKEQLKGKVWTIFGVTLVSALVVGLCIGIVTGILTAIAGETVGSLVTLLLEIVVMYPFSMGIVRMYLNITYGDTPTIKMIVDESKKAPVNSIVLIFLIAIFVTLWSFLFVIPGIIKAFSYSMAPFILGENPEMSPMDAIKASQEMMKGRKFDLFVLGLSFILWALLGTITFGLAYIYVQPYMSLTFTNFYHRIKGSNNTSAFDSVASTVSSVADSL